MLLNKAHFHRTPAPDDAHIERLLARLIRRIIRCLVRAGVLVMESEQPYLDVDTAPDDGLAGLAAAAVRYRIAVGPLAGQRTMRLRIPTLGASLSLNPGALTADHEGFSLNAAVACGATQGKKLERLCRYMARGPLSNERLSVDGDGLVVHELKRPFRDGTTQCLFEPLDFLARLAALIPRPRSHLVRYHGVFAPNARHRALLVEKPRVRILNSYLFFCFAPLLGFLLGQCVRDQVRTIARILRQECGLVKKPYSRSVAPR